MLGETLLWTVSDGMPFLYGLLLSELSAIIEISACRGIC